MTASCKNLGDSISRLSARGILPCRHHAIAWTTEQRCAGCQFHSERNGGSNTIQAVESQTGIVPVVATPLRVASLPVSGPIILREYRSQAESPAVSSSPGQGKVVSTLSRQNVPLSPRTPSTSVEGRQQRRQRRRRDQLPSSVPETSKEPILFVNREGRDAHLCNLYWGQPLFLVLSGPSLTSLPLAQLTQRGVMSLGVNNAATVVRTPLWTCVDPLEKFHEVIFRDPGITKFIPHTRFGEPLRIQHPDGTFEKTKSLVRDCPAVFGYRRHGNFTPATYLTEENICFGNSKRNLSNGRPHIINVMFAVFRIAHYLGFRTVYLLGCDFKMTSERPYAFDEHKHQGAVNGNNGSYLKLNGCLDMLKPYFDTAGFRVFNCNRESGLRTFPFRSFEDAINESTKSFRGPINTRGWDTKEQDK